MAADQSPPTRKYHEKEAFVTGHSGSSAQEIFLLCLVIPIGLHLCYKLRSRDAKHDVIISSSQSIIIEFLTLVVPMLLVQTSLLPYMVGPIVLLFCMLALATLIPTTSYVSNNNESTKYTESTTQDDEQGRRPAYLSIHRSCVYILTTIAILAVDFPIFPRRFCKTEVAGYGWMDLGAASFIIIAGWSSAFNGNYPRRNNTIEKRPISVLMHKAIKKCSPLLLLGLIRLATNKGLEYQEHVSEYGVHCNFFFTLCCVEGFMVVWKGGAKHHLGYAATKLPIDGMLAMLMLILYQLFLSIGGGQDFIENGDRRCNESYDDFLPSWITSGFPSFCNIFVANREGILGVVGYLSLRLLSEDLARICLVSTKELTVQQYDVTGTRRQRLLIITSILLWSAHVCLTVGFQIPTSRRSTNASFILWSLSHNTSILCLIHYTTRKRTQNVSDYNQLHAVPRLLAVVNRHGLAVFLSSNILTGLVNLTLDTLHSSDGKAMFVLSFYLALVCGIALLLDYLFNKNKVD